MGEELEVVWHGAMRSPWDRTKGALLPPRESETLEVYRDAVPPKRKRRGHAIADRDAGCHDEQP